jgi:predicted lipoprotein with Yx(FWY)xxD motif
MARKAGLFLALGVVLLATGCSSAAPAEPGMLSASIGGNAEAYVKAFHSRAAGTVVANGTGYTLYWFSKDTATYSGCSGRCVAQWPPVTGRPRPAPGTTLVGQLGTMYRDGGVIQATYDGHPLYTFAGDFDPGDVGGDGVTQFGGTWHVVRPG